MPCGLYSFVGTASALAEAVIPALFRKEDEREESVNDALEYDPAE